MIIAELQNLPGVTPIKPTEACRALVDIVDNLAEWVFLAQSHRYSLFVESVRLHTWTQRTQIRTQR